MSVKAILYFTLLCTTTILCSQNTTREHRIKKGENVYRISLKYKVSIQSIYALNPEAKSIIRAGETLLIPIKNRAADTSDTSRTNYLVKRGETKYGISKSFGISITQLEKANPFIIEGLQAGHRLNIPFSDTIDNSSEENTRKITEHTVSRGETLWGISQKYNMSLDDIRRLNANKLGKILLIGQVLSVNNPTDENIKRYVVQKGDTKYGLSKQFNTSIADLEKLNPQIVDMLRTGTVLRLDSIEYNTIPDQLENKISTINNSDTATADNSTVKTDNNKDSSSKPLGSIANSERTEKPIHLIWQPFNSDINMSSNQVYTDIDKGMTRAINEAKSNFSNINFQNSEIESLRSDNTSNEITNSYVIYPDKGLDTNSEKVNHNFIIKEFTNTLTDSILVRGVPNLSMIRNKMIDYIKRQNGHVICLYEKENLQNVNSIKTLIPNLDGIKISRNGSFKMNDLEKSLKKGTKNFIIIESARVGVYLTTTSFLLRQSSKFQIQLAVLNTENIPDSTNISYNRFQILNLLYPSVYDTNRFKVKPTDEDMAYIIGTDIIQRINDSGLLSFKNGNSTTALGTKFRYDFNTITAQNTTVSIYMFDNNSTGVLIGSY